MSTIETSEQARQEAALLRVPVSLFGISMASVRPAWREAGMRAARAMLVVPVVLAVTDVVVGNIQMATFASLGGFATLVMSEFGGSRRDQAKAHFGLALAGTVLVVVGTLVSSSTWVAVLVTVPAAFTVLFAGVLGPNAAKGAVGALLVYLLPALSRGTAAALPARLGGWWVASVVSTVAVLVLSPPPQTDELRGAAAALAGRLAAELEAALHGSPGDGLRQASLGPGAALWAAFEATPYRPTGLARGDQALSNLLESLEWCDSVVGDTVRLGPELCHSAAEDRELISVSKRVLAAVAGLLDGQGAMPDLDGVERLLGTTSGRGLAQDLVAVDDAAAARLTFSARNLAVAVRAVAGDALIVMQLADEKTAAAARLRWFGTTRVANQPGHTGDILGAAAVAVRHLNPRSAWCINATRGALALAVGVSVARLANVQHGFWVVLGALAVLRTSAAATGASAMRALAGTAAGFVIGSALVLAIGSHSTLLWAALPIAVAVAAYAPGMLPLAVGQAAFTVMVAVLFNLVVWVGWPVVAVRLEDVALGCTVSLVVGLMLWPRGAVAIVAHDLSDAFTQGGAYLSESVEWVLGRRLSSPTAGLGAASASIRLGDAVRGLFIERGTTHVGEEDLFRLVRATVRLRMTGLALASSGAMAPGFEEATEVLTECTSRLVGWCDRLAESLIGGEDADPLALKLSLPLVPEVSESWPGAARSAHAWVGENLRELRRHLEDVIRPAVEFSAWRRRPWWR
jgi:uncharacterized membrane protein YccC